MDTYETVADCRTTGTSLQRLMPVATGKQHNATMGAALSDARHGTRRTQSADVQPESAHVTRHTPRAPRLVGRASELAQLHHWCDAALSGYRQVVFVSGEAGIGKSTLVTALLGEIRA